MYDFCRDVVYNISTTVYGGQIVIVKLRHIKTLIAEPLLRYVNFMASIEFDDHLAKSYHKFVFL